MASEKTSVWLTIAGVRMNLNERSAKVWKLMVEKLAELHQRGDAQAADPACQAEQQRLHH